MADSKDKFVFYLWIYQKIRKKSNGRIYIPYSMILEIIKRSIPWTPRRLYYPIIKDMESLKLLKRIDKRKYELIGGLADSYLNQFDDPI